MEAPDKIYMWETMIVNGGYDPAWHKNSFNEGDVEYIRKDALLEWAKEVHDSGPIKDSADKGDAWSIGYLCGMRDIIDKLNSL